MFLKFFIAFCLFFTVSYATWTEYDLFGNFYKGKSLITKQNVNGKVICTWEIVDENAVEHIKAGVWNGSEWIVSNLSTSSKDIVLVHCEINDNGMIGVVWNEEEHSNDTYTSNVKVAIWNGNSWNISTLIEAGNNSASPIDQLEFAMNQNGDAMIAVVLVNSENNYSLKGYKWNNSSWVETSFNQNSTKWIQKLMLEMNELGDIAISWLNYNEGSCQMRIALWRQ